MLFLIYFPTYSESEHVSDEWLVNQGWRLHQILSTWTQQKRTLCKDYNPTTHTVKRSVIRRGRP